MSPQLPNCWFQNYGMKDFSLLYGNQLEQRKTEPSVGIGCNQSSKSLAFIIRVLLG